MERIRPTAVFLDYLIYLSHDANCLAEGDNYLLVVVDVLVGQDTARTRVLATFSLTVLEPLVADLIAADVEAPDFLWDTLETLCLSFIEPYCLIGVGDLLDLEVVGAK